MLSPAVVVTFVSLQIFLCCLSFQDIKIAAMNCIEGLQAMWAHVDFSSKKNGIPDVIIVCLHVPHVGSLYFLLLYCYIINLLINREQRNLDPFS